MPIEPRKPRIIPVLDVMHGQVVRAIGGRRNEYRPLISKLVQSTDPLLVAQALLHATGAKELYIADLDAIQGKVHSGFEIRNLLETIPVPTWLDAGFGDGKETPSRSEMPHVNPVIGFESCRVGRGLARPTIFSLSDFGGSRKASTHPTNQAVAFSIDLRDGELIGDWRAWGLRDERDSLGLARMVVQMGCRHLIALDLARVGSGNGCGTDDLLRAIRAEFPEVELIAGGGVKSWEDIERLGESGVDAVLAASALHDGVISVPRPDSLSPRP
jgi:phosphoribosylformimino-5-aminoimidazole carboxamide ribotide isomerase